MDEKTPGQAITTRQADHWAPNPFSQGSLLEPDWFAGRGEALEQLRKAVRDNWPLVVVRGPRGIGKTALVRRLLADTDLRGVYIDTRDYVDARDIARPEAALRRIVQGLAEEISFEYDLPLHFDPSKATDQDLVRVVLRQLCTAEAPRLVLVVDEMDFLDPEAIRRVIRFAGRALQLPRPPLWVFVVGEVWGQAPGDSLAPERVPVIRLGLFERGDVLKLLPQFSAHGLFLFDLGAQEAIWEETAGHPLFLSALLDALYDLRWSAGDKSAILLDDVRRAVARVESRPAERIVHALRQSGPAAQRVLYALAKASQEALSAQDLIEVFRREWPGWEQEVSPTLEGLLQTGLLRNEGGIWSHRIPLLQGYVVRLDREEITAGDRPPRPDAWASFRLGEDFEREGRLEEARNAYQEAADLDAAFWLTRWHLARLLLERSQKSASFLKHQEEDLKEAKRLLEALDIEEAPRLAAHRFIRDAFGRTLVELSRILPPDHAERKRLLDQLQSFDQRLRTEGAAELVAETEAVLWEGMLKHNAPAAWTRSTREFLRKHLYLDTGILRRELARRLVRRLDESSRNEDELREVRDLIRYVAPVILEEGASKAESLSLWEGLKTWLRRFGQTFSSEDDAWLEPWAWETFLLGAPPGIGERLLDTLQAWFEDDFSLAFESGSEGEDTAERLSRILVNPELAVAVGNERQRELLRRIWSLVESLVERASESPDLRDRLLSPLGRALRVLRSSREIDKSEIETVLFIFASSWTAAAKSMRISEAAVESWNRLLADAPEGQASLPTLEGAPRALLEGPLDEGEKKEVEEWLDGVYEIDSRVPIFLPGFSREELKDVLNAYLGYDSKNKRVLIRAFRLRSPNPETAQLMWAIWDRERRALGALSTNPAGRALLHFEEARRIEEQNVALLVTEWAGTITLRDRLRRPSLEKTLREQEGRINFWTHFMAVLEAVEGLHRSGFLHRSLSPEVIYVCGGGSGEDETSPSWRQDPAQLRPVLRLAHFEWSVYLRGLTNRGRFRRRALDRYTAPEALRAALGITHRLRGETFASDLYSLGLTLFECLVRPFRGEEDLAVYGSSEAYGREEEHRHERWLRGLQDEVREFRLERRIELHEEEILLPLLEFDVFRRPRSLDETLEKLRQALLFESTRFKEPLPVFTTLTSSFDDPRDDPRCIAFFLRRELPEVDIANKGELERVALARIINDDLRGASVFINQNYKPFPLILRSRTGVLYRLKKFERGQVESPDLAFIEVARPTEGDAPLGEPLCVLMHGVKVFGIENEAVSGYSRSKGHSAPEWRELFDLAAQQAIVWADNKERAEREQLLRVLGISVEAEYDLAWREAAFVRARPGTSLVRSPDPAKNLAKTISAWLVHDLILEVARHRASAGAGIEIGLDASDLDLDTEVVDLSKEIDPMRLPEEGVLRPAANRGVAALYRRRRQVLQELRDDALLLDAVVDPVAKTTEVAPEVAHRIEFFLGDRLDENKQDIIRAYRRIRPLLVVQGPPGTGKTTLATEVVLQKLKETPNARVLITAQGHSPLDNLLERLLSEKDRNSKAKDLLDWAEIVRIPSGNRTDAEYPERVRRYLPYARADELFRRLRKQSEENLSAGGLPGQIARVVSERLAPYASAPNSLLRRIEESANLVFVTTNAREVEVAAPVSFDLVIVEEAARCVPIELLGVMRLSRQWLLIGDHKQLPPFGFEQVRGGVNDRLEVMQKELDDRRERLQGVEDSRRRPSKDDTLAEQRLEEIRAVIPLYLELFRHLHQDGGIEALHAATLKTQWRMHPTLGTMVSEVFYNKEAVCNPPGEELKKLAKRLTHPFREPEYLRGTQLVWIDFDPVVDDPICGEERGPGGELQNQAEQRTAVAFLRQLNTSRQVPDIAILTPYRRQAEAFRGLFRQDQNWLEAFGVVEDRIFTVDSFQGRQAGTVVLSLVRNNDEDSRSTNRGVGFLAEKRRATVMFSRAERLLVVLGCSAHFMRFPETEWIVDIHRRATRIHWLGVISRQERAKLARRRHLRS